MFNILFKDEVVLIHTWVVTERWEEGGEGGGEMAVVYHPGKGVYILIWVCDNFIINLTSV